MKLLINDMVVVPAGGTAADPRPAAAQRAGELLSRLTHPADPPSRIPAAALCVLSVSVFVWAAAGCQSPVAVQGAYSTTNESIRGEVQTASNGVTIEGDFQRGPTNLGGAVTVGK